MTKENGPKSHQQSSIIFFPELVCFPKDKPRRVTAICGQAAAGGPLGLARAQREVQVAWFVTSVCFFFVTDSQMASELPVSKAWFTVTRDC